MLRCFKATDGSFFDRWSPLAWEWAPPNASGLNGRWPGWCPSWWPCSCSAGSRSTSSTSPRSPASSTPPLPSRAPLTLWWSWATLTAALTPSCTPSCQKTSKRAFRMFSAWRRWRAWTRLSAVTAERTGAGWWWTTPSSAAPTWRLTTPRCSTVSCRRASEAGGGGTWGGLVRWRWCNSSCSWHRVQAKHFLDGFLKFWRRSLSLALKSR